MDNFTSRVAGIIYGGAAAEAAAIEPDNTAFSTGTQLSLYTADGLLEVLEWASAGEGADPAAAVWLALLRWYKNRYDRYPDHLPAPRDRWIDAYQLHPGDVDDATAAGLAEPDMGLPRKPHGPEATGTDALVRAAPFGMIPQVETDWVVNVSHQAAVLTHGDWHTPVAYSLLIHYILAGKTLLSAVTQVLTWLAEHQDDDELAERIRTSLREEVKTPTTAPEVLAAAIRAVADTLEQPVAPEQLYARTVTTAVNYGGNAHATALVAGQLLGGLIGHTATNSPTHLDDYQLLQELVDRWIGLTT